MILLIAFLSLVVCGVDRLVTRSNTGTIWNGVGAIPTILAGQAESPMQYRVLIPWLCGLFRRDVVGWKGYWFVYRWLKWLGVVVSLSASWWFFGVVGVNQTSATCLMALYLAWSAQYDYIDHYWEVGLLALSFGMILTAPVWWAVCLLTVVAMLNRETGVLIPAVAFALGEVALGALTLLVATVTYQAVRMHYRENRVRPADRYCSFNMVKINIKRIREAPRAYLHFAGFMLFVCSVYALSWPLSPFSMVLGLFFVAMLIPSVWYEIRVFAPVMLALIPMAVGSMA